jgi:Zn-dependent protease
MRDVFSWSVPLGRLFGINVRVHILFPVVAIGLWVRAVSPPRGTTVIPGTGWDAVSILALLFVSVLLHEFGHCFGAWLVGGEAQEVLLWPLGGLASLDVPQRPKAQFIATAAGPAVNLLLCLASAGAFLWLTGLQARLPFNPLWIPTRTGDGRLVELFTWDGQPWQGPVGWAIALLARGFWVNWILFLINVVLVGFPLDGGKMMQCLLWPWFGYRQATYFAIWAGFFVVVLLGIFGFASNENLPLFLAIFVGVSCRQQWIILETGGEESFFGYDFSQGYTSLESGMPTRRRGVSPWRRWLQRRAARRLHRDQERRESEERRMDELLEKVQREGLSALSDEERRFLKRVSDRYRNRQ